MLRVNKQLENAIEMSCVKLHIDIIQELNELKCAVEIAQAELVQLNGRIHGIYKVELYDNASVAESGDSGVNNDQNVGDETVDKLITENEDGENSESVPQSIQEAA